MSFFTSLIHSSLCLILFATLNSSHAQEVSYLFDGDFESGTFQGWTPMGENGGFTTLAAKGGCYASGDTSAISFNGNDRSNYAALMRSNAEGNTSSVAILRSKPFAAGSALMFTALTEAGHQGSKMPVDFRVKIYDTAENLLVDQQFNTALITLSPGCPSEKRDAAFSAHFLDTHTLEGDIIVEFSQHTNDPGKGFFTLIDNVFVAGKHQFIIFQSKPIAVAGTSVTSSGTLFLDPTRSFDPDNLPHKLEYRWFIDGEELPRELDLPCINLNESDSLSAGNHVATLYVSDGSHAVADSLNFVVPESDDLSSNTVTLTDPRDECDVDLQEPDSTDETSDGENTPDNAAPIVDLDSSNSSDVNFATSFVINGSSISISSTNVSITDTDGDVITQVTVSLNTDIAGDTLELSDAFPSDVITAVNTGTSITFSSTDNSSPANYSDFINAVESVQFDYNVPDGEAANTSDRTMTVQANDGTVNSSPATSTITVSL